MHAGVVSDTGFAKVFPADENYCKVAIVKSFRGEFRKPERHLWMMHSLRRNGLLVKVWDAQDVHPGMQGDLISDNPRCHAFPANENCNTVVTVISGLLLYTSILVIARNFGGEFRKAGLLLVYL